MNTGTSKWLRDRDYRATTPTRLPLKLTEVQKERRRLLEEFQSKDITAKEFAAALRQLTLTGAPNNEL